VVHSALQVQNQTEEHEIVTQVYMHYGRQEGWFFFFGGGGGGGGQGVYISQISTGGTN